MKKIYLILLILSLIACSSETEVTDDQVPTTSTNDTTEDSTNTTSVNTPEENTPIIEEYVFDVERMSALTGLEIAPELWLKRPRRVLAFKIDNNINLSINGENKDDYVILCTINNAKKTGNKCDVSGLEKPAYLVLWSRFGTVKKYKWSGNGWSNL